MNITSECYVLDAIDQDFETINDLKKLHLYRNYIHRQATEIVHTLSIVKPAWIILGSNLISGKNLLFSFFLPFMSFVCIGFQRTTSKLKKDRLYGSLTGPYITSYIICYMNVYLNLVLESFVLL